MVSRKMLDAEASQEKTIQEAKAWNYPENSLKES